jgi:Holliday junction resolvase RusA-like endonuclease
MTSYTLPLAPVPAPRQVRSDKWRPSPSVQRYRAFRDRVWMLSSPWRDKIPNGGITVTFHIPMPKSWSKRRKALMDGQPHTQRPDLDNLLKALWDSLLPDDDSHIWDCRAVKRWAV